MHMSAWVQVWHVWRRTYEQHDLFHGRNVHTNLMTLSQIADQQHFAGYNASCLHLWPHTASWEQEKYLAGNSTYGLLGSLWRVIVLKRLNSYGLPASVWWGSNLQLQCNETVRLLSRAVMKSRGVGWYVRTIDGRCTIREQDRTSGWWSQRIIWK